MSESGTIKSVFELSDTVNLFMEQTSTINSLWATFAAITFVAAGYGFSVADFGIVQAIAISLGFSGFVVGHWILLDQALSIQKAAANDIGSAIEGHPDTEFRSLRALCATVATRSKAMGLHIFVDGCVLVALWSRVPGVAS
jgi:hypothetical protein